MTETTSHKLSAFVFFLLLLLCLLSLLHYYIRVRVVRGQPVLNIGPVTIRIVWLTTRDRHSGVAEQFISMHVITTVSLPAPSHQSVYAVQLACQSQQWTLVTRT